MGTVKLRQVRVIRYAVDGGYAPVEWQRALQSAEFTEPISNGDIQRIGVQITKTRAIDILVRIEILSGVWGALTLALGRAASDRLFKKPKKCRRQIPGTRRPLAVLGGRFGGRSARVLVCEARG